MSLRLFVVDWSGYDPSVARFLIERGLMPHLSALMRAGARGSLRSLSTGGGPMLRATLATGRLPSAHGVSGVRLGDEPGDPIGTPIWERLQQQGWKTAWLGWPDCSPRVRGEGLILPDDFALSPICPDAGPAGEEWQSWRIPPEDVDPGLFGLFVTGAPEWLEPRLGRLRAMLAKLYTFQNIAAVVAEEGDHDAIWLRIDFLAEVWSEFGEFHQARRPHQTTTSHQRYRATVEGAYRLLDLLLADLLTKVPDGAVAGLVSAGEAPESAAPERRRREAMEASRSKREGFFALRGASVPTGVLATGARLEDFTPTLCRLLGLANDESFDGRNLSLDPGEPMPAAKPYPEIVLAIPASAIAPPSPPPRGWIAWAEHQWMLGVAMFDRGRWVEALSHLHWGWLAAPEQLARSRLLSHCLIRLGLPDEALLVAGALRDLGSDHPEWKLFCARLWLARKQPKRAMAALVEIESPDHAEQREAMVRSTLLAAGDYEALLPRWNEVVAQNPGDAGPRLWRAYTLMLLGRFDEAEKDIHEARRLDAVSDFPARILELVSSGRRGELSRSPASDGAPPWERLPAGHAERQRWRSELNERTDTWRHLLGDARSAEGPRAFTISEVAPARPRWPWLLVTGRPRSGTAAVMRALALSGVPVLTDAVREPDEHNRWGYFEWSAADRVLATGGGIKEIGDRAVKLPFSMVTYLTNHGRCDVIHVRRDARAVLRSRRRMESGQALVGEPAAEDVAALESGVDWELDWLRNRPGVRLCELQFEEVLADAAAFARKLIAFLGTERVLRPTALARAIVPALPVAAETGEGRE